MSALLPALFFLASNPVDASAAPHGRYVEARTASVFAGACHFGGERTTAGREALLAWRFEGGAVDGVELAGVEAVLVVVADANLAEATATRTSVLYVDEDASAAQRAAVENVLERELGAARGRVDAVLSVPLEVVIAPDDYSAAAPGRFTLRGGTLPDRACCKMPFHVWYAPLAPVEAPIVGLNTAFEFTDARFGRVWSRPDENASFTGAFRFEHPVAR
ncbi:MAG: DUF1326 domain-containing protein [Planctomycetes bacterium]|nr:DUF1326 domain-containing protein [Planctomycetota bacterium]